MTAAAPFDLVATAVTIGTLAVGALLTMLSSVLTDMRARRRETTARRDQLMIQIYQEEREILHSLQEHVAETYRLFHEVAMSHNAAGGHAHAPISQLMTGEQKQRSDDLYIKTLPLYYRCRSVPASDAAKAFMDGCMHLQRATTYAGIQERWVALQPLCHEALGEIGQELRQDPLHDLGLPGWRLRLRDKRRSKRARRELDTLPVDNS